MQVFHFIVGIINIGQIKEDRIYFIAHPSLSKPKRALPVEEALKWILTIQVSSLGPPRPIGLLAPFAACIYPSVDGAVHLVSIGLLLLPVYCPLYYCLVSPSLHNLYFEI